MQVGPTPPVVQSLATPSPATTAQPAAALDRVSAPEQSFKPTPFTPAPPLRPTVQDEIAIDQALITLRQV